MLKIRTFSILILLLLSGCQSGPQRYSNMALDVGFKDIAVTFIAYTDTQEEYNAYYTQLVNDYTELGHLYDKYNNYDGLTNLKTLNDTAGQGPKKVDPRLIDLLELSKTWYDASWHTFNPSLGAVLNIWHAYREEGKLLNQDEPQAYGKVPTLEELQAANQCTGWDNILIDKLASTVEITNPCTQVDVGGIGKGYASDLVAADLIQSGLTTAILNIGDSSIMTIGTKPDGSEWGIGVSTPTRPVLLGANTLDTLYFTGSISVSTSGDNQNYYIAEDGLYYHHLIDPNTLYPVVSPLHAVTVVTSLSAGEAEALSKTLFILPYDQALQFLTDFQSKNPDVYLGALWVFEKGQEPQATHVIESEGFMVVHTDNLIEHSRLYR